MLLWVFRFAIKVGDFVAVNVLPADRALAKAKVYYGLVSSFLKTCIFLIKMTG